MSLAETRRIRNKRRRRRNRSNAAPLLTLTIIVLLVLLTITAGCANLPASDFAKEMEQVGRVTDKIIWTDNGRTKECYAILFSGKFTRTRIKFPCESWDKVIIGKYLPTDPLRNE